MIMELHLFNLCIIKTFNLLQRKVSKAPFYQKYIIMIKTTKDQEVQWTKENAGDNRLRPGSTCVCVCEFVFVSAGA